MKKVEIDLFLTILNRYLDGDVLQQYEITILREGLFQEQCIKELEKKMSIDLREDVPNSETDGFIEIAKNRLKNKLLNMIKFKDN